MKYLILLVILISILWSWYAFPDHSPIIMLSFYNSDIIVIMENTLKVLVGVYQYTLPSVFWSIFIVYVYDFITSVRNKNTPYMLALYDTCKVELLILTLISLFTFLLFWKTQSTFTSYSVDIGMAGLSFMLVGNFGLLKLFKFKIGNVKYPFKVALIISIVSAISSLYFLAIIFYISRGDYNKIQSIWLQITVFTYSLSLYFVSKHIMFIIKSKKLGISLTMLELFKSLPSQSYIYQDLIGGVDLWNEEAKKVTAKASRELRRQQKKPKKKR